MPYHSLSSCSDDCFFHLWLGVEIKLCNASTAAYLGVAKLRLFESCMESLLNPVSNSSEAIFKRCIVKQRDDR